MSVEAKSSTSSRARRSAVGLAGERWTTFIAQTVAGRAGCATGRDSRKIERNQNVGEGGRGAG